MKDNISRSSIFREKIKNDAKKRKEEERKIAELEGKKTIPSKKLEDIER